MKTSPLARFLLTIANGKQLSAVVKLHRSRWNRGNWWRAAVMGLLLSLPKSAFSKIAGAKVGANAVFLQPAAVFNDNGMRIAALAIKNRLPAIYDSNELPEAGVLMSYGSDRVDLGRRAPVYVDKILKGAKPGDLPVQQPTKFEFVINLKTAKQIGLTVPQSVLYQANQVIK